jgi:hypothetical protein
MEIGITVTFKQLWNNLLDKRLAGLSASLPFCQLSIPRKKRMPKKKKLEDLSSVVLDHGTRIVELEDQLETALNQNKEILDALQACRRELSEYKASMTHGQ